MQMDSNAPSQTTPASSTPQTTIIDLEEDAARLEREAGDIEAEIEELVIEANELDPPSTESQRARLRTLNQRYDRLESERVSKRGTARALSEAAERWEGAEIEIAELTGGDIRRIQDEVRAKSDDAYRQGYHEICSLERAVVSQPPGAPTDSGGAPAPAEYPNQVFDHVYERVNAFNTTGEFDLGNSSLRERMEIAKAEGDRAVADQDQSTGEGEPVQEDDQERETEMGTETKTSSPSSKP